jgi:catechol 2,3-dioxygenase-like lactoylglutathione lyase family enzyme
MRRSLIIIGLCLLCSRTTFAPSNRPAISNVLFVRFKVSELDKAEQFYGEVLKLSLLNRPVAERAPTSTPRSRGCFMLEAECFFINPIQRLEIVTNDLHDGNMIDAVGFLTADAEALHAYLVARGLKPEKLTSDSAAKHFDVLDPEQHRVVFFQSMGNQQYSVASSAPVSNRIIHAGFVVHDRAAEDRFYRDVLGFHLYWQGGRKDDETSWVAMQLPDGTDWLEYMLNVPDNSDHHTLGVMNHIALGVPDVHAAEERLRKNGWSGNEKPKIGRDGKWQLNLYDPDDTRVELMEFKPVQKPCCHPYTADHPKP